MRATKSSSVSPEIARSWRLWRPRRTPALALFVELVTPMLAVMAAYQGRSYRPRVFHPEHIPERYGLFTLIVLGASVLAVAAGTAGTGWYPASVATAVFGFVIAACIWWLYFDYVGASGLQISPRASFYWGYGHLPIYAGIAASGVGILLAIEGAAEATAHGNLGARAVLSGGLAVFLLAVSFIHWVNRGSLDDRALFARLATAGLLILLLALGSFISPLAFAALTALALLALTAFETLSAEVPTNPPT